MQCDDPANPAEKRSIEDVDGPIAAQLQSRGDADVGVFATCNAVAKALCGGTLRSEVALLSGLDTMGPRTRFGAEGRLDIV